MTTITPDPKLIEAEAAVMEAVSDLLHGTVSALFGGRKDFLLAIDERLRKSPGFASTPEGEAWEAFTTAADKVRAAEDPCTACEGTGEVTKKCCSGADCGCHGLGVLDDCGTCNRRGWHL